MNFFPMNRVQSIQRAARPWPVILIMPAFLCTLGVSACDIPKTAVGTTAKVLWRAQPALENEADYDFAARALPGSLKTVETFWYVDKGNENLIEILAKGFCQYGTGFVEDEWEIATLAKDIEKAEYLSARATKMFVRCTNYALLILGKKWQENIYGEFETIRGMLDKVPYSKRNALMWAGIGLAQTVNQNKDNIALVAQFPTAKMMLERVVEMDDKRNNKNLAARAMAHMALGMINSAQGAAVGGQPDVAKMHFERAIEITDGKFLYPKALYARRLGVMLQDREFFRKTLTEVLQTPPSIWPAQRLANEIAHRRARRYLKHEKEWF